MSSGTHKSWVPRGLPHDAEASARVRDWLLEHKSGGLDASGLDLSDSDLSGGDFSESWFAETKFINAKLTDAELYRSDAAGADFTSADLTNTSLVRVNLDDAILRNAILDGANLVGASLYGVDAVGASLRGAALMGSSLIQVDFRGANLSNATVEENTFKVTVDQDTVFEGLHGTLFGPIKLVADDDELELGGSQLERWINERGGSVRVLAPRNRSASGPSTESPETNPTAEPPA
ncbi:pentapeptide repeat-containing protein [Nocardia yunnanensis]|uniref:Pentapeptide repeat-containing protein n=1 Tax=Nocardia yunnanensis TaxID=2382165 RepID=A0A386ZGQ0_9NOCA|nr:pentapeptide repeat-containing protein [Nocardia yunnanensis]AYF76580.1 pentapeptide repeat-containing protein [Nocardia yunnanensis]